MSDPSGAFDAHDVPDPATGAPHLPDGTYDVMVVDVADEGGGRCTLSLAISTGLARGEVVDLAVDGIDIDPWELLGLPGDLAVIGGVPRFSLS